MSVTTHTYNTYIYGTHDSVNYLNVMQNKGIQEYICVSMDKTVHMYKSTHIHKYIYCNTGGHINMYIYTCREAFLDIWVAINF